MCLYVAVIAGSLKPSGGVASHLIAHKAIKLSTYGILFVDAPHQGGNKVELGRVLLDVLAAVAYWTPFFLKLESLFILWFLAHTDSLSSDTVNSRTLYGTGVLYQY